MEQIPDSTRGRFVSLCPTREWPQREGLVNFWSDWKDVRAVDSCEGIQDLETPNGVENLLDHLRTHFEPIEVFRRGGIVDDFVSDFERQPGDEIRDYDTRFNILLRRFEAVSGQVNPLIKAHVFLRKANLSAEKQSQIVSAARSRHEYEPLGDATLTAIPRAGALRGGASGAHSAQVVEDQDEENEEVHVLEAKESGHDDRCKTAQNGGGWSTTVLSKTSVFRRAQGQARQTQAETSTCELWSTGPLERRR